MKRELQPLIDLAERLLQSDEPGVIATLFSADGSSYRPLGSMLIGGPAGTFAGGVSGGCLEEYVLRRGREIGEQGDPVMLSFSTGSEDDDDPKPVLGCGGTLDVLVERLSEKHLQFLHHLHRAQNDDQHWESHCTITTDDAGQLSVSRALRCTDERPSKGELHRECSSRRTLVQRITPVTRLVIFGAGHDAVPLCEMGQMLGWHVTVVDRRARHAKASRFPNADVVLAEPWQSAIEKITFTPSTAVVLLTHSLPDDAELLPLLDGREMAYLGVLGPTHRREALLDWVNAGAQLSDELLARLRGPIGLDLGDRSPSGIALAVAAEIQAVLHRRSGQALSDCFHTDGAEAHGR